MRDLRWEVGSDFHWDPHVLLDDTVAGRPWIPSVHELYANGTGAIAAILANRGESGPLHVPSFFCMDVVAALALFTEIQWYRELPDGRGPVFETLDAAPGDAVLAVNLFGRSQRQGWELWSSDHPGMLIIEDHTHDPLSDWAQSSDASYAVASLRKTLPVPDGALLWSPRGLALPIPRSDNAAAGLLKLTSMVLKAAWMGGAGVEKNAFREMAIEGEQSLSTTHDAKATPLTANILAELDVWRMRRARADNIRHFLALLGTTEGEPPGAPWSVLNDGPNDAVPFNVQLLCASETVREALVRHLIEHRIYSPVHWRQRGDGAITSGDPAALDYASRLLTIPLDYRYSYTDVERIVRTLRKFHQTAH